MDKLHLLYDKFHTTKKNKTIVLSVMFHEKIQTIIDYFMNALYYFRNYNLYILVSCNEIMNLMLSRTKLPDNIRIISVRPNDMLMWCNVNLIEHHTKNYLYLKDNNIDYDYFWFSASNDVFIKDIDDKIEKYVIDRDISTKTKPSNSNVRKFYNKFLQNPGWHWFKHMVQDKKTINTFISNKLIVKCNEFEGLILSNSLSKEMFEFYIEHIYQKNDYYGYVMEEIFFASYLYSYYGIEYSTVTLREKWCKYDKLKGIHGVPLLVGVKNMDNLYCIKMIDREFNNPVRVEVRKPVLAIIE